MWRKFHSRCMNTRTPWIPPHTHTHTHTALPTFSLTHTLPGLEIKHSCVPVSVNLTIHWLWKITSKKVYSINVPKSWGSGLDCGWKMKMHKSRLKRAIFVNTDWVPSEKWVQENKYVAESKQISGGDCFCVPCPFTSRALRDAGLFNVDSRAVCPDVGLLESQANSRLRQHVRFKHFCSHKLHNRHQNLMNHVAFFYCFLTGIQEGTQCTKCKNEWALKTSIALLYVLCTLLTIAVAVLGYKGKMKILFFELSASLWSLLLLWPDVEDQKIMFFVS